MDIVAAIVAGLFGTAAMTILMAMAPRMGLPKMDVPTMLGLMVTEDEGQARLIGLGMHAAMGAIFAIIYALLWSNGIGAATALWGILFGLVHGAITAVAMPAMRSIHPRPPEMAGGSGMLVGMLMGHALFGLVVALVYAGMTP